MAIIVAVGAVTAMTGTAITGAAATTATIGGRVSICTSAAIAIAIGGIGTTTAGAIVRQGQVVLSGRQSIPPLASESSRKPYIALQPHATA